MKRLVLAASASVLALSLSPAMAQSAPAPTAAPTATPASAAASTLDKVMQSHVLRVCTPGDYKPFSFMTSPGQFEGLDVDMMGSLATALGAKPQFIKTSWANLLSDFAAGKCDVAAGGISISLPRQQHVYFSTGYMVNGKTPITLCKNAKKYQTIAQINKPSVRVIYNPGGSNETFAKTKLPNAKLIGNKDNLTIFDEILKGHADVFVTEGAEAIVQSKLHPGLCAVNPAKPLQYGEMGYMLPRGDEVFKRFVDQWLHLAKANGEYAQIRGKWLGK